jgi:hypothetical protein
MRFADAANFLPAGRQSLAYDLVGCGITQPSFSNKTAESFQIAVRIRGRLDARFHSARRSSSAHYLFCGLPRSIRGVLSLDLEVVTLTQ